MSAFAAAQSWQRQKVAEGSESSLEDYDNFLDVDDEQDGAFASQIADLDTDEDTLRFHPALQTNNEGLTGPSIRLSSWTPSKNNIRHVDQSTVDVSLKPEESLALVGTYDLCVLEGKATVYGTELHSGKTTYRVHAPCTHAIPVVVCLSGSGNGPCWIRLASCTDRLRRLKKLSPLFARVNNEGYVVESDGFTLNINKSSFAYVFDSASDPLRRILQPLYVPNEWKTTLDKVSRTERSGVPRVLVCGAKNSGKSTFARTILNYFITRRPPNGAGQTTNENAPTVCYLDLDPGQPEFSCPGQLSLLQVRAPILGPPYMHTHTRSDSDFRLIRAHSIVSTSPREDPQHFLACLQDLLQRYRNLLRTFPLCPLVVNTVGWISSEGLLLLKQAVQAIEPSAVVYMNNDSSGEREFSTQSIFIWR